MNPSFPKKRSGSEHNRNNRKFLKTAPQTASKAGGILILVLIAISLLTGLALVAGSMLRSRAAIAADSALRVELRAAAVTAAAHTAWLINADTNGVDHLAEDWAQPLQFGETRVTVTDESAKLLFQTASIEALAHLLRETAHLDAGAALAQSTLLNQWWVARRNADTNATLTAWEALYALPGADIPALQAVAESVTVYSAANTAAPNINTISKPVFIATVNDVFGANRKDSATQRGTAAAEELFARIEAVRKRGEYFEKLDLAEARKLLTDGGTLPPMHDLAMLQALNGKFAVESTLFHITATAERNHTRATVQCVYARGTGKILKWTEW